MDTETFTKCNIEKHINIFPKNIQSVKIVIVQEVWNFTMTIKIKSQFNKNCILNEREEKYCYRKRTIDVYKWET